MIIDEEELLERVEMFVNRLSTNCKMLPAISDTFN